MRVVHTARGPRAGQAAATVAVAARAAVMEAAVATVVRAAMAVAAAAMVVVEEAMVVKVAAVVEGGERAAVARVAEVAEAVAAAAAVDTAAVATAKLTEAPSELQAAQTDRRRCKLRTCTAGSWPRGCCGTTAGTPCTCSHARRSCCTAPFACGLASRVGDRATGVAKRRAARRLLRLALFALAVARRTRRRLAKRGPFRPFSLGSHNIPLHQNAR